ncbi:MAG: heparan-alpha-glucosaminide N-acetyltransferase [Allorhizobium sp.]
MADHTLSPRPAGAGRIGLLDIARAIALLAMATYHFSWDLEFFGYLDPGTAETGWLKYYARSIAFSFLFLAGFSLVLAHTPDIRWRAFGRRFAIIAAAALVITVATYFAMPDGMIFFGILHCIALSSLVGLAFLRLPVLLTVALAALAIALPQYARFAVFDAPPLWWVGLSQVLPRSNDYVPMLPWFGAVLLGIASARLIASQGLLPRLAAGPAAPPVVRWASRHSLILYLAHQPVLIACVYLLSITVPPQIPDPVEQYTGNCENACVAEGATAEMCARFCGCTVERLQQQDLFEPLQSGAISPGNDERVLQIARECTAESQ